MKDFTNTLLTLIDAGSSQAKDLIENFNNVVDSFDIYEQFDLFRERKNELIKRGNELFGEFTDLIKQVKENISDFSVTVPYDEAIGEKINFEVKDGKLIVEVSYEDETTTKSSKTSVLVPSNCDLDNVVLEKDDAKKTATIVISKKIEKREKPSGDGETPTEEAASNVSSRLTQKLKQNAEKYSKAFSRDSHGRFVRRTPKANRD